jgi:hypothetical protein
VVSKDGHRFFNKKNLMVTFCDHSLSNQWFFELARGSEFQHQIKTNT